GKDHPLVATVLHNLATLYRVQGRYDQAEPLLQRALQIRQARLGKDHPLVALSLGQLAGLYTLQQRWDKAAGSAQPTLRVLRRHLDQVLPALAEPDQLTFLQTRQAASFYVTLSFALFRRDDAEIPGRSAAWLLNGKAVAQQALIERTLLTRDQQDPN